MLELKLEKYTRILLYAVPFLALIFIQGFYFPFIITRTIFFRLLLQLGLSLYLLLLALNFKKYRPRFNWAFKLVIIFLFVQLVAASLGYDFYKSFWSDFERMEGVISLIYLAVYLFLLQVFLRYKKDWLFYIRLILIASAIVSLYGLGQKFNLLPVFEAGIGRVTSTIGNAAFLAGYLLVAVGLGVYYYFNETDKNYRYFTLAAIAVNLLVLFLTSTRGAILGLVAGIFFYFLINAIFQPAVQRGSTSIRQLAEEVEPLPGKAKRKYLVILAIFIILCGTFFFFRANLADSKIEFVRRLATISIEDGAVLNRLTVWRMALKDFKFHPLLGAGLENFDIIYNKYYTPDISENWFDRTHNVYLDQLMAGGILGLAAYLAILIYLFYLLFKARLEDYYKFAVLFSLLIAYGLHNFFVFDTINTSFLYFFLIGLVSFKEKNDDGKKNAEPNNKAFNRAFVILIIINIFVGYKLVYLPLKINRAIYIGYYYVIADTFRSYENFQQALNYKFGSTEAAVQLNKSLDVVEAQNDVNAVVKEKYLALDREKLKFASVNFPLDIKAKMYLGQLILNNYKDIKELDEAENLLLESKKLSPTRVEPYYLLYNLYSKEKKKAEARAVLEDLVRQLPGYGGAKIMLMSDLYKDEPKRAEQLFQEGIRQAGVADFSGLKKIIAYLLDGKKYQAAIPYYLELIKTEPDRFDYRLDLAKVYYLSNDFDAAVEQVNVINERSPQTLKGYEEFVSMLNKAFNKK
ncbi:MAG: O-antigen ligase family protein [Parcubacteria group bacterium]|nr:O-antigen ligase family protein [Parcubacteria group bacterium]